MSFRNDLIDVIKRNGEVITGFKANVQSALIIMDHQGVLVEPGDRVRHRMSNGGEDTFEVIDPGFRGKSHFGAHYQMKVRKLGLPESQAHTSVSYNLSGANSRVNIGSVDASSNSVFLAPDFRDQIDILRKSLSDSDLSPLERASALEVVNAVENQLGSDKPSKTVVSVLLDSLPHIQNIASIAATIKGMLT